MPLTPSEKELLAVARYFNSQKPAIGKLVSKLLRDFDVENVAALTGFTEQEVKEYYTPPKTRKKAAAKVKEAEIPFAEVLRIPVVVDSESGMPVRIAHDVTKAIEAELNAGDKMWTNKEVAQKFQCTNANVTNALRILREHRWVKYATDNHRDGYVVL